MKRSSGRVDETGMCHLLKYDLHTHTAFSDGRNPVRDMANAAESNGLRGIAITDHVFNDVQAEKLLGDYAGIDKTACPVEILFGCETAVRDVSGKPCASKKFLDRFELVLMDCNNILFSQLAGNPASPEELRDVLCDVMVKACGNPEVKILAHPFNFGLSPLNLSLKLFDDARTAKIAQAFQRNGKIFEIMNQMYFWHSHVPFEEFHREYMRILNIFKSEGVRFSLGSDAHSCCGVGCLYWCERVVTELGIRNGLYLPEQMLQQQTGKVKV